MCSINRARYRGTFFSSCKYTINAYKLRIVNPYLHFSSDLIKYSEEFIILIITPPNAFHLILWIGIQNDVLCTNYLFKL